MNSKALHVTIPDRCRGIRNLRMNNPVIAASGTFGFGREYGEYMDLNLVGGIAVKGLTPESREGNPVPRIVETPMGMINSIGLQNPGIERFIEEEMPFLREYDTAVIANISGNTVEEFTAMARRLDEVNGIHALEVNVSCPNIHRGGEVFATSPEMVLTITRSVRDATTLPVIVKLSPNVTDIAVIARQAEAGGADAVSLINTVLGMAVDIHSRKPVLRKVFGGLSGPAVKPIALRQVWQVYQAVSIPIIGMGGIMTPADAVEFLLAGATAVSVGTANFVNPTACLDVAQGIGLYLEENGFDHVSQVTGLAHQ
ncbi:MAG: dihydroorotate dehydrogenase [Bacillota bacterium]|nr:dihydroorotate dehydrogenase [Bacillota bacterium]MDW7676371.1 dihydroorotate dehydrogenase [Bacillota bacterium]